MCLHVPRKFFLKSWQVHVLERAVAERSSTVYLPLPPVTQYEWKGEGPSAGDGLISRLSMEARTRRSSISYSSLVFQEC